VNDVLPSHPVERALLESEIRLQQVLDNTSATVFAKDSRGRYLFVNREFERVTGKKSHEIVGRTDDEVFSPELAARFRHNDLRVLQERQPIEFEEVADFGEGTRTFLSSKFPLLDAEGNAYAVCGIATDITERKRADEALRDSEAQYRAIFNASADALILWNSQFRRVDVNPAFEKMYGWSREEVLGRGYEHAAFQPDYARTRYELVRRSLAGETARAELEALRKNGDRIQTEVVTIPFRHRGEPHVLAIAHDITERKRLEEALSSAALAVSESEEVTLYRELTRYLATILGVDGAFIATLEPGAPDKLRMLAFHLDGRVVENFSYPQSGTPCETVVGRSFRYYGSQLTELFPLDEDFKKLGLESYAGYPLFDGKEHATGLIAVISRRPLAQSAFVESVLRIFAVRVNAELERAAAAQVLRMSEANYREIFETSEDAIYVHDWETGALVDVNPRACEQRGYTREELLQVSPTDLVANDAPYTADEAMKRIEQAKREGSLAFEWRSRNKDGSLRWDEVRLKSANIGGKPRVLAFVRDITERKHSEEALRASEEQYRTIFNASVDALMVKDEAHRIVDVNDAYLEMHGYSREAVIGRHCAEFIPPETHKECDRLQTEILSGLPRHVETRSQRADGSAFDVEMHGVPMQYRGRPHALVMLRDLTESKRAERARAELEAQLRQAQKMEAIGQLTGGIAHDFNNLLTSIMGYVALASDRDSALGDAKLAGYLAQAQHSCERARDLIQQMLMFSRGHRGTPRIVSLASAVRGALGTLHLGLPATLELKVEADESAGNVLVDPAQVEQVLMNLCINARDAMEGIGSLRVAVRSLHAKNLVCASCRHAIEGPFVEMVVEDDGHGMGPEVLERIFEPFFSTKETGKGTGMGLAMVHGIVHEHGGHVIVESSPGDGAKFRILWRQVAGHAGTGTGDADHRKSRQAPRLSLEGQVLVVDDEETVGEFMRELLDTWGLKAISVARPESALELVAATPRRFDVVITDQSMPRITGIELATRLRVIREDLPVILYTGYGDGLPDDALGAARLCAVIRKPVDPTLLSQALAGCLARRRAS
jgi:PAS domain S-box-containing protein